MIIGRKTDFAEALLIALLISTSSFLIAAQENPDASVASPPNSWINLPFLNFSLWDSAGIRPILITETFVCGFHCQVPKFDDCLLSISIFHANTSDVNSSSSPKIVWSANRNNPVQLRASLQLSENGDLMLRDFDGTLVWNTSTAQGKSASGLKLTEEGNLVLFDRNNETVWQSFDHPTDTLVPGQALVSGQKLTSDSGLYSLAVVNDSLIAFLEPDAQQVYFGPLKVKSHGSGKSKVLYLNGSFDRFVLPPSSAAQFIQLGSDGHLKAYQLRTSEWIEVSDLLQNYTGRCGYPLVCGEYGVCSDGKCACLEAEGNNDNAVYFRQGSEEDSNGGCPENRPVSCKPSQYSLLELKDIDYFNFVPLLQSVSRKQCKEACLKNCSCKAAIHRQQMNSSVGYCSFLSKIYSFKRNVENLHDYNSFAYIKVSTSPSSPETERRRKPIGTAAIVGPTTGALFTLFLIIVAFSFLRGDKKSLETAMNALRGNKNDSETVTKKFIRFSFDDLKALTEDFRVKLGEGGFGSVFYGTLSNGAKVAVKRLDGTRYFRDSFLAEVKALESVHHINLVALIGFCAEKSHLLLVYEFKHHGSLDRWIFSKDEQLSWDLRRKIILDIAKGLDYLHEGCTQKVLHLDIKPQNILLDEDFNAQLADFGLSKLIDREHDQVLTAMRGTPGYMAPEWSSATITEKVDVYSFGIVVLEIICGRRNVDKSQPEEEMHLLRVFMKKAEEGKPLDLVLIASEELEYYSADILKVARLTAWCLQADYTRRPSMTQVISVLNGFMDVEENLNYDPCRNALKPSDAAGRSSVAATTFLPLPSILSGPR